MRITTSEVMSGIGSSNGIAASVSLPNISTSRRRCGGRAPGIAGACLVGAECRLIEDALEQVRIDRAIGRRRHGTAWLCQLSVRGIVEGRSRAPHFRDPAVKVTGRDGGNDKAHIGKAVAV